MKDVWDEKPEAVLNFTEGWIYQVAPMDAWIGKVKDKLDAVEKWHEELWKLCNWYLENDRYVYMGLVQKFGELEEILKSSGFKEKDEE